MLWMFFLNNFSPSPVELSFGGTCNMSLAPPLCVSLRQYPWVFEIELVRVEDSIPWYVFAILLSPILIGELYIKITGKTPGEAVNEYLYGDVLRNL